MLCILPAALYSVAMSDEQERNRLLIATFIVATTVAIFFSDIDIYINPQDMWPPFAGTLLIGLLASAGLSFFYVLCRGYELQYSKPNNEGLIKKASYKLYDWSILCYPIVIGFLIFMVTHGLIGERFENGDILSTLFARIVATPLSVILLIKILGWSR